LTPPPPPLLPSSPPPTISSIAVAPQTETSSLTYTGDTLQFQCNGYLQRQFDEGHHYGCYMVLFECRHRRDFQDWFGGTRGSGSGKHFGCDVWSLRHGRHPRRRKDAVKHLCRARHRHPPGRRQLLCGYTIRNFNRQFPTDDACLEQVSRNRLSAVHNAKNFITNVMSKDNHLCP
jgi:hypothetical protein